MRHFNQTTGFNLLLRFDFSIVLRSWISSCIFLHSFWDCDWFLTLDLVISFPSGSSHGSSLFIGSVEWLSCFFLARSGFPCECDGYDFDGSLLLLKTTLRLILENQKYVFWSDRNRDMFLELINHNKQLCACQSSAISLSVIKMLRVGQMYTCFVIKVL